MAYVVPTTEPSVLMAGTQWRWDKTVPSYPVSENWTLKYFLVGPSKISITATTGTSVYSVTVAASATANYVPGRYRWYSTVTSGSEVHPVEEGYFDLLADPATVTAADVRSYARQMRDAIREALKKRLDGSPIESYSIGARQFSFTDSATLERQLAKYEAQVQAEERPGSFGTVIEYRVRSPR